ncbi:hypothetical protein HJFPF1_10701 [Paramyrothecium foliicola]|nr:hypothetical protein HJFPF1_10701 [Paramyrothecium foliicola]
MEEMTFCTLPLRPNLINAPFEKSGEGETFGLLFVPFFSHELFDFAKMLLNWVQVGRVRWKEEKLNT